MVPEPVTPGPPRRVRVPLVTQDWRDVAFLHWAVDPALAAPLLPPGTRVDVLDSRTFVGLVALRMERTAPLGVLPLPWLGSFGQLNLRLYTVDERGRRGVTFLSLDADRLAPAAIARAAGLPFSWARVRVHREAGSCDYRLDRHLGGPHVRISLRLGPPHDPDPMQRFVTDRWGLHHRPAAGTVYVQVEHGPWQLHAAEATLVETDLFPAAGLPLFDRPPDDVLFSPGVDGVRLGPPGRS